MSTQFASVVESLGYNVRHSRYSFDVVLPLWSSVRVSIIEDQLHLEPRFGLFQRSTATIVRLFVLPPLLLFSGAPIAFLIQHVLGIDLVIAGSTLFALCGSLMVTVYVRDVYRYILTENAMSVIRQVFHAEYVVTSQNDAETQKMRERNVRENGDRLYSNEYHE